MKTVSIKSGEITTLALPQTEELCVKIGEGAEVTVYDVPAKNVRFILEAKAELTLFQTQLEAGECRIWVELKGNGSRVKSQCVFLGKGQDEQQVYVTHQHVGKNTFSEMISKGAVTDRAHGFVTGVIRMEPGCSGAEGVLAEHNLLLSPDAKIDAEPNLEIGHHDVKASHAATMERLDDDRLFYLASRGVLKQEAKRLVVEGFFWDAFSKMGEDRARPLMDRILTYL